MTKIINTKNAAKGSSTKLTFPIRPLKFKVFKKDLFRNKAIVVGISPKTVASPENKVNIIALYFSLKSIWAKPAKINKIIEINKNIIVCLAFYTKNYPAKI